MLSKKLMTISLTAAMLLSMTASISANDDSESESTTGFEEKYMTNENPMPSTNIHTKSSATALSVWKANTSEYLQGEYNQRIKNVEEDSEKITFYLEMDYNDTAKEQVETVEYFKENTLNRTATGATKITTYNHWSNGVVSPESVASRSWSKYSAIGSATIAVTKWGSMPVVGIITSIASFAGSKIISSLPVKVDIKAAVYYKRKIGSYYLSTKVWWPSVQVGRAECWLYRTYYQPTKKDGPYIPHHYDTTPNKQWNNYNVSYNKAHYSDNTWITKKVKELKNTGKTYISIYG